MDLLKPVLEFYDFISENHYENNKFARLLPRRKNSMNCTLHPAILRGNNFIQTGMKTTTRLDNTMNSSLLLKKVTTGLPHFPVGSQIEIFHSSRLIFEGIENTAHGNRVRLFLLFFLLLLSSTTISDTVGKH